MFLAPGLGLGSLHFAVAFSVQFISDEDKRVAIGVGWGCVFNEAVAPLSQIVEAFLAGNVVNKGTAVGASVESVAEGLEFLLAGGVPDLEGDNGVVDH